MQTQVKRAGEDREKQNAEFQATVQDQRATMRLLEQAVGVRVRLMAGGAGKHGGDRLHGG